MEKYFYVRYFKKTCGIWIFLVFSIYCMFACSFEVLHLGIFSINAPKDYIDKINDIIKNLSYSYIAGCFFFFLSDTIPFLRRQKIAIKNVSKSITSIKEELKRTEIKLTGYNWNQTETKKISSDEYSIVKAEKAIEWIYLGDIFVAVWNKMYRKKLFDDNKISFNNSAPNG